MSKELRGRLKWGFFGLLCIVGVVGMATFDVRNDRLAFGFGWLFFWIVFFCSVSIFRNGKE